jgi:hypothetical protein
MANQRIIPMGAKSIRYKVKGSVASTVCLLSEANATTQHGVFLWRSPNSVGFQLSRGINGNNAFSVAAPLPDDDQWHEVLLTWDGTTNVNGVKIWIDGELRGQGTSLIAQTVQATSNTALFNYSPFNSAYGAPVELDEIEIYNTVKVPSDFPREQASLTPYFTAFTRNALSVSRGVNVDLPEAIIPPEGVPVTGFIAGTGEVVLGFKPSILFLSGLGAGQTNTNSTQRAAYAIIEGNTGVDFFAHFQGTAAANAVTIRITGRGFNITAKGASTPAQIYFAAYFGKDGV